jgi:hypothetical protein
MSLVLANCRLLHSETGATVMVVHHVGKDPSKGARGSSVLKAAMQTELLVLKNEHSRVVTITKQRDGVEGDAWPFTLLPVMLDEDHEACVVDLGPRMKHGTARPPQRIKLRGGHGFHERQRFAHLQPLAIVPVLGHGVEEVGDAQNS